MYAMRSYYYPKLCRISPALSLQHNTLQGNACAAVVSYLIFHAPCPVVPRADHGEETLASWLARWILRLEIFIFVIITRLADFSSEVEELLENHVQHSRMGRKPSHLTLEGRSSDY